MNKLLSYKNKWYIGVIIVGVLILSLLSWASFAKWVNFEAESYNDSRNSNKGHTLVCLDFTIKNTDRGTLDTSNSIVTFSVNQNGQSATVRGYDLNNEDGSYDLSLFYSPISKNGRDFYKNETSNELISAGKTLRIKVVGIISFDADLESPFDLVVSLKNSSNDKDKYIYTIK